LSLHQHQRRQRSPLLFPNLNLMTNDDIHRTNTYHTRTTKLYAEKYGKGSEILPPTNESPIKLKDSFPNGEIPDMVQNILGDIDVNEQEVVEVNNEKNRNNPLTKALNNILQSAAQSETRVTMLEKKTISKIPIALAVTLTIMGYIPPIHFLSVIFISGYLIALNLLSSSPKSAENLNPVLPSLPPQGHVPSLVSNPLGSIGNDSAYLIWLRFGVVFGYIAPSILLLPLCTIINPLLLGLNDGVVEAIATSIYYLSWQIVTEEMSCKVLTPLPIRILIPLIYNSLRLGPLYQWMVLSWSAAATAVGGGTSAAATAVSITIGGVTVNIASYFVLASKILSLSNVIYWGSNLFAFLIPIATIKYMRTHFFCVEAEEVVVRDGDEDNIGFLGR